MNKTIDEIFIKNECGKHCFVTGCWDSCSHRKSWYRDILSWHNSEIQSLVEQIQVLKDKVEILSGGR